MTSLNVQDNDVERETTLNRDHLDYLVEESWRWLLSCELATHIVPGFVCHNVWIVCAVELHATACSIMGHHTHA